MDRRQHLLKRLAEEERYLARGAENLARQRALVHRLRREGRDVEHVADEMELLSMLEAAQRTHSDERDALRKEVSHSTREPKQSP
jgi:hypothetical protein